MVGIGNGSQVIAGEGTVMNVGCSRVMVPGEEGVVTHGDIDIMAAFGNSLGMVIGKHAVVNRGT